MSNFGRNHDEALSVPKGINQSVSSPESVPSIHKCMEENGEYFWCIPFTLAKSFTIIEGFAQSEFLRVNYDVRLKC